MSGRGRARREGGTADTGDKSSMINNLIRLEPLAGLPLANFGPHLVRVNDGFQVNDAMDFVETMIRTSGVFDVLTLNFGTLMIWYLFSLCP